MVDSSMAESGIGLTVGQPAKTSGIAGRTAEPTSALIRIDTGRFIAFLVLAAVVLSVVGTIANLVIYQVADSPEADIARIMTRFDLGHEPSLPAWFSSIVLLLNSVALLLIARAKELSGDRFMRHWLVLGLIFLLLSIDEAVMFHEMINKAINLVVNTEGVLLFPWVIVGGAFALAVFLGYLGFLLHLPRRFALIFMLSGALYVGGAVGMEIIAGGVIARHGVESAYHTVVQTIEESLEMAGAILFLYALSTYWVHSHGRIHIKLSSSSGK